MTAVLPRSSGLAARSGITSRTAAVVAPGGQLAHLECQSPFTVRRVFSDEPDVCALCLVGSAAGPLAGDDLRLDLHVRAGARASLRATGATIAQGRPGGATGRVATAVRLDCDAHLDADPGPLIVCAGADVEVGVRIDLDAGATLRWREVLVLGRAGAAGGRATLRWDVTRAGRPVLRQLLDLREHRLIASPSVLAGARVVATELRVGPSARTVVHSRRSVAAALAPDVLLATVLGDDAARATTALDALMSDVAAAVVTPVG